MASYNLTPIPLEPRNTDAVYSTALLAYKHNITRANFVVENGTDQNVSCQLQGKATYGEVWQDIGSAFVANKATLTVPGANASSLDASWGLLRVKLTPAGSPTTGSVSVYAECAFSGALV